MSETAVTGQIGNPSLSRTVSVTATDGTWNNTLTGNSQAIGLEIPGTQISYVQVAIAATAVGVWRIIDGRSLVVRRQGLTYATPYGCMSEAQIEPYVVQPQDLLQTWTQPAAASSKTNALGLLYTSRGVEPFGALAIADNTATEQKNINTDQTLGDWAFGTTLLGYEFQVETDSDIGSLTIVDQTGGTVLTNYGNTRLPTAGGKSTVFNIKGALSVPIMKGYALNLTNKAG